jgi:uncharacterized membrane protein
MRMLQIFEGARVKVVALWFCLLSSTLLLTAAPANAAFNLCNESGSRILVAFMSVVGTACSGNNCGESNWSTDGWYVFAHGECAILGGSGDLRHRYYYVYAETEAPLDSRLYWTGETPNCVSLGRNFSFGSRMRNMLLANNCVGRNGEPWRKVNFIEVDTGDSLDFTFRIRQ